MAIEKVTFYYVVCDDCDFEILAGSGGTQLFPGRATARGKASAEGWKHRSGKWFCSACTLEEETK